MPHMMQLRVITPLMSRDANNIPIPYTTIPSPTEWWGSRWDILRTPAFGSWPSVLYVPQSSWDSQGLPHLWSCPSVPQGVQRTPTLGSCPNVLSHRPIGSPQDIPSTPTLGSCPSVLYPTDPLGVPRTSQGLPTLAVVPMSHSPIGSPRDIPKTPTLWSCPSVLSIPVSLEVPGTSQDSHIFEVVPCPVCPTVPLGVPRTSLGLPPLGVSCLYHILLLSVVKAWVGEILRTPYVSTETIAHGTMSCDCG